MENMDKFYELESPPSYIPSEINMLRANDNITIYNGEFSLTNKKFNVKAKGTIYHSWFPFLSIKVKGKFIDSELKPETIENQIFDIIEGQNHYKDFRFNNINKNYFFGLIIGHVVLGNNSKLVDSVSFSIANYHLSLGTNGFQNGKESIFNHYVFSFGELKIFVGKVENYSNKIIDLMNNGGYLILANAYMLNENDKITYPEVILYREIFYKFLNFINGSSCAPMFYTGRIDDKVIWQDYTCIHDIGQHKITYPHWTPSITNSSLSDLWNNFVTLYIQKENHYFLSHLIYWYSESFNMDKTDNAIIFTQSALELLYNWLEENKLLEQNQIGKNRPYDKIKVLINRLSLTTESPKEYIELCQFIKENGDVAPNAAKAIVYARNNLVHAGSDGSILKFINIKKSVKQQIVQLSLKFIELSLLKILNYTGTYINRVNEKVESLPWEKVK